MIWVADTQTDVYKAFLLSNPGLATIVLRAKKGPCQFAVGKSA